MYTRMMEGWSLRKPSALFNSSSFTDILAEPPKCCTGFSNPSVDFIINMHSLREGAAKIGEPVHNVEPFPIHCEDGLNM